MNSATLPPAFQDLAPFAHKWARPTEQARSEIRWGASPADFAGFYEAFMPKLDETLVFLADRPVCELSVEEENLFHLACAFAEAAPHHELYKGSAEVPHSFDARRFVAAHGQEET